MNRITLHAYGRTDVTCDKEFPTIEEMNLFPYGKEIKLKKIYYKNGLGSGLKALKFEFTHGVSSPLFEVSDKDHKLKSVEIDTTR